MLIHASQLPAKIHQQALAQIQGKQIIKMSRHSIEELNADGVCETLAIRPDAQLVEIEVISSSITKIVIRQEYNNYKDIVLVLTPYQDGFKLITSWLNAWNDHHRTIKMDRYAASDCLAKFLDANPQMTLDAPRVVKKSKPIIKVR